MKNIIYLFVLILIFASCSSNDDKDFPIASNNNNSDFNNDNNNGNHYPEWLIPVQEVMDGGPGKDGIPSIDNPIFVNANSPDANYLEDDDLIVGILVNGIARAYPHEVLDWHEIVNDDISGLPITINYCPLTGTAFGWDGFVNGQETTFGVSGLLYNTNLILYDRKTDSNWSQLKLQCVNGSSIVEEPQLFNIVETTWNTWKLHYPNTKVMSLNTGFARSYGDYPYGPYRTNNDFFLFPFSPINTSLPSKERVHAIIDSDIVKVYQFTSFQNGNLIKETIHGNQYLIVGHDKLINSFKLTEGHENLEFELDIEGLQIFFSDNEGNKWDIMGTSVEGPRSGEKLNASKSVMSYWFAIAAFYPNPKIYED